MSNFQWYQGAETDWALVHRFFTDFEKVPGGFRTGFQMANGEEPSGSKQHLGFGVYKQLESTSHTFVSVSVWDRSPGKQVVCGPGNQIAETN